MDQITYMMAEIERLSIENAELRKTRLAMQNPTPPVQVIDTRTCAMKGEARHDRSRSIMQTGEDSKTDIMFSDNDGFEQFAGPDYGMNTRAKKAGFMSPGTSAAADAAIGVKVQEPAPQNTVPVVQTQDTAASPIKKRMAHGHPDKIGQKFF